MPKTRIPSPSRSLGSTTPRRHKPRRSRSVCSPALSNASGRLTSVIDQFKDNNMESFSISPMKSRWSVLTDNTDIDEPRRKSWWKNLNENTQDLMEVLEDNKTTDSNNSVENISDIEIISQENKNYSSLDLPESSDNESIHSIVLTERRLFQQKENKSQKKFDQLIGARDTLTKLHKSNTTFHDKTITAGTKDLFQGTRMSKPVFSALLNISANKTTLDKTIENVVAEPQVPAKNFFGNRPAKKRKNIFADFIVSDSEHEVSDIQVQAKQSLLKRKKNDKALEDEAGEGKKKEISLNLEEMVRQKHNVSQVVSDDVVDKQHRDLRCVDQDIENQKSNCESADAKENESKQNDGLTNKSTAKEKKMDHMYNTGLEFDNDDKASGKSNTESNASLKLTYESEGHQEIDENIDADKAIVTDGVSEQDYQEEMEVDNCDKTELEFNDDNKNSAKSGNEPNKSLELVNKSKVHQELDKSVNTNKVIEANEVSEQDSQDEMAVDKTIENIVAEPKVPVKNIFGNRPAKKRKNIFADFIVSDSEHEVSDIQVQAKQSLLKRKKNDKAIEDEADEGKKKEISLNLEEMVRQKYNVSQVVSDDVDDKQRSDLRCVDQDIENQKSNCESADAKENESKQNDDLTNKSTAKEKKMDHMYNTGLEFDNDDKASGKSDTESNASLKLTYESEGHQEIDENIDADKAIVTDRMSEQDYQEEMEVDNCDKTKLEFKNDNKISAKSGNEPNKSLELVNKSKVRQELDESVDTNKVIEPNEVSEQNGQDEMAVDGNEENTGVDKQKSNLIVNDETVEDEEENEVNDEYEESEIIDKDQESGVNNDQLEETEEDDNENETNTEHDESEVDKDQNEVGNDRLEENKEGDDENEVDSDNNDENEEIESYNDESEESEVHNEENEDDEIDNDENEEEVKCEESEVDYNEDEVDNDENDVNAKSEVENDQIGENEEDSDENEDTGVGDDENKVDDENEESNEDDDENKEKEVQSRVTSNDEVIEESPNVTHDTTGRNRKKIKSPEVVLHDKTKQQISFISKGRNTSIRETQTMYKDLNIRPSLAPPRDSLGLSAGDSSAEGSGWDSHRTTRKTLRQTFGKDFTPRKSLRALVMEKSAKQTENLQTLQSETVLLPQANSTEYPQDSHSEVDVTMESDHEVSRRTRQTTLKTYLQKMKQQNLEKKLKVEEAIRNSLKAPPTRDTLSLFKVPSKPPPRRPKPTSNEPKKQLKSILFDELPSEVIEDMKYKPPKRFQPSNASWITKRLYKFLESKLEPKYDYKARIRAEKLVETIYHFAKDLRRHNVASVDAVDVLKHELARLEVVKTHFEFYEFFHEFMPREVRVKVVPDIVNKIPLPRHGIFADILRETTLQG